jgi:hypothetical protein
MSSSDKKTAAKSNDNLNFGILYVATGSACNEEVLHSAASVRKFMGKALAIAIFTDRPVDEDLFDIVRTIPDPKLDYEDKIKYLRQTPFKKTLFLDCDTHVCANFLELFGLLDRFDFAAAHEPGRISLKRDESLANNRIHLQNTPACFSEFNTGVILYNNTKNVLDVFDQWLDLYRSSRDKCEHDQPALAAAVYHSKCRFYVLPPEYNVKFHTCCFISGEAKILHGRKSDITAARVDPDKAFSVLDRCINENKGCRCLFPEFGIIMGTGEFGFNLASDIIIKKTTLR